MVGGEQVVFECVKFLLDLFGKLVMLIGGVGVGQVVKVCNQIIIGVGVCVVVEVINFVYKIGVDVKSMCEVLFGGFVVSRIFELYGQCMIECNFVLGFKVWMYQKDLCIVMDVVYEQYLSLLILVVVLQLYNVMVGSGLGDIDIMVMFRLFEQMSIVVGEVV